MDSSSSSSSSSSLSFHSSDEEGLFMPEYDSSAAYNRRAPEWWDAEDFDFSVESDDDEPMTDGEEDLQFLLDGELEGESEDDLFPWDHPDISSDEEMGSYVAEDTVSSSSIEYPPLKRFRAGSYDNSDDEEEEEEPPVPYSSSEDDAGSSADLSGEEDGNGESSDDAGSTGP